MTQANNVAIESSQINSSGVLQPAGGGTGVTTTTGSGSAVLNTSPTLVTPTLGAASASSLALGSALAVAYGGTGTSSPAIVAGTAISVSGSFPNQTVANTGVTSAIAGTGISVSGATGAVTITNTGVTSAVAGTGVSVSGSTGAVTFSIGQAVATSSNVQFNSLGVGTAGSATTGEIRATNNVTAYYSSDRQFKENIQNIQNAVEKVSAIGGKTFDWTEAYLEAHGGEDGYFYQKSDFGVIAQDVQAVFPQAVRSREDGTLAIDYAKLSALALAAIAELTKRIEVLEKK